MAKTLSDAVAAFLGPLMAEYCGMIAERPDDAPIEIHMGPYVYKTILGSIKDLDRAFMANQAKTEKANKTRRQRKTAGSLL